MSSRCRRPIEDHEVDYLLDLGAEIRTLREEAGLSRRELAWGAFVHESTIARIERGERRTRRSRLEDIVRVFAQKYGYDDDTAAALVEYLVEVAGPALAPESEYAQRIVRRRIRRWKRIVREVELAEQIAESMARPIAREMARDYVRDWRWVNRNPGSRHSS